MCFMTPDGPEIMPLTYSGSEIFTEGMDSWFNGYDIAVLEMPQTIPGRGSIQAVKRSFTNFGMLKECLRLHGVGVVIVEPQKWKKAMGALAPPKSTPKVRKLASINAARMLFPNVDLRRSARCTTLSDGFADALLIAEYGRRIYS